ncbi:Mo-dependent nitrogenase C-terminal domain-containing protein [Leptolyngbya ohadii]|uniref:Mo-dependent nitrogenase C-terminal domain-containing protein n=1 Tax=Leptolyngbya ohadii TaxID=1962290 RepID=UPI000B59C647|nr:Mo-dependent nitrogenase C-terminal domain-containing protein [Leptolyngbya ohadii]
MKHPAIRYLGSLLHPIRQRLESIEISNPQTARSLCKIIPARCPFERQIKLFDYTLIRIPPLCKLNPFYDQIVNLRFKSLVYLADHCGEDVTLYY